MIRVQTSAKYTALFNQLLRDSPHTRLAIDKAVYRFIRNPEDTRLENHALRKRMSGRWAFSVTDDIRIIYRWIGKHAVRFLAIGSHRIVYKNN